MSRLVFVLNGPNLNRLGRREPSLYGADTLADVEAACRRVADAGGLELRFRQSNREDELIGWVHEACDAYEAGGGAVGIAINPAAYTHTSVAILDALNGFDGPVVEIHITNVHKREPFRRHSYISLRADGVIAGFGVMGYPIAVERLAALIGQGPAER